MKIVLLAPAFITILRDKRVKLFLENGSCEMWPNQR
jgi:hypothetical protein